MFIAHMCVSTRSSDR